jgi:hypothetical protein
MLEVVDVSCAVGALQIEDRKVWEFRVATGRPWNRPAGKEWTITRGFGPQMKAGCEKPPDQQDQQESTSAGTTGADGESIDERTEPDNLAHPQNSNLQHTCNGGGLAYLSASWVNRVIVGQQGRTSQCHNPPAAHQHRESKPADDSRDEE